MACGADTRQLETALSRQPYRKPHLASRHHAVFGERGGGDAAAVVGKVAAAAAVARGGNERCACAAVVGREHRSRALSTNVIIYHRNLNT